jgi:hypothetical protein
VCYITVELSTQQLQAAESKCDRGPLTRDKRLKESFRREGTVRVNLFPPLLSEKRKRLVMEEMKKKWRERSVLRSGFMSRFTEVTGAEEAC